MADEATTEAPQTPEGEGKEERDDRVPYERFQQANTKAKEAAEKAKQLERELARLKADAEAREAEGLPELEKERKRAAALERKVAEAEKRAEETEAKVVRAQRERWVAAAAARENFHDPDEAALHIALDEVEDQSDAERAVKKLAKAKAHLVKDEEPRQPQIGKVLDGKQPNRDRPRGDIDLEGEASMLADQLKKYTQNWHTIGG